MILAGNGTTKGVVNFSCFLLNAKVLVGENVLATLPDPSGIVIPVDFPLRR
jgi:hypothetical protein